MEIHQIRVWFTESLNRSDACSDMQSDEPTVKGESTYSECTHDGEVVSQMARCGV